VIENLATHFPGSSMSFCLSLEDAFFEIFGSENMRPIMGSLGMKDDEFVEHNLISKAIKRAQEKISKSVLAESTARSEKEWVEKNIRK
jgi:preprotein translocase subunit SecA